MTKINGNLFLRSVISVLNCLAAFFFYVYCHRRNKKHDLLVQFSYNSQLTIGNLSFSSRVPWVESKGRGVEGEEKQKSNFLFYLFCLPHYLCDYKLKMSTNSREHYNPINQ